MQVWLLMFNINLKGQPLNLIANPGFECFPGTSFDPNDTTCEDFYNLPDIYRTAGIAPCLPWFGSTVDLMTACIRWQGLPLIDNFTPCNGLTGFSTVPQNYAGWQYPHLGNNYLHLSYSNKDFNTDTLFKEHANSQIKLVSQKEYCVGFYTVLADSSNMFSYGPGIKFFDHYPYVKGSGIITDYNPDVWGNFFMDDSINWRKVSGTYTATGQEQYLSIGNFWPASDQNNPNAPISNMYPGLRRCRIYIDDVFITELGNISAGTNKDICLGDSVTLGSAEILGADYTWYPSEGLSNIHAAQPKAAPNTTTTYHLIMDQCRILYDSVTVTVRNPNELAIFPKEISVCKGTSVTIAPINTYNNNGSTLAFIPANSFTKIYPDSVIFNAEQNTNIAVVQQFNGSCAQVQNNISIKTSTCKDSPVCGGYVNENSILLTPFPTKELIIYSLAGSIVFYASNYNNDYNCSDLSSGIYLLKQTFVDGTEKVCKLGWVNR
jgi:hypothetical protein